MSDLARVRLLVADDHAIWRSGLRSELGENFHVVGEAADADESIAAIAEHQPDLVVCDLHMPGGGIKVVKACSETTRIVMLTVSEAERYLLDAVSAGAVGYLLKTTPPEELTSSRDEAVAGSVGGSSELPGSWATGGDGASGIGASSAGSGAGSDRSWPQMLQ